MAPPEDARVMMRWWWFGPAVVKTELEREMLAMKAGGIGGFEIQPVYPMALDDTSTNLRNLPYLSPDFLDALKFTNEKARENGLRVDLTLASGWPYGGSYVTVDHAAARLRMIAVELPPSDTSVTLPNIGNGERFIAAFAGAGTAKSYDAGQLKQLTLNPLTPRFTLKAETYPRVVTFFIASRTGQQVKRAAVDANGFVLDHFSRAAVDTHLNTVADKLIAAFGDHPPYAVFSDSLEVYEADWTDDLLPEFQKRRGYDLTPLLPQLWSGTTPTAQALRHDWGVTLTELINERYLTPVNDWAKAHNTRFRSQTYGEPAVSLSSNNLVSLPEGEGPQWRAFSFTRLATSASHLYGRNVTSSETWTWLHSPAFRATPLDMKAEADRFFLEGVNQLIGHGWPYSPPNVAEPGWSFYAAAVFNDHNPWWPVMPEVTKYLQRMSYLLRQGQPANDIAVLLPNDDAYSEFKPGHVTLSGEMSHYITPVLTSQILDSGFNLDYIDAEAIRKVGIPYPVLVMPHVERLSPETLQVIAAYAAKGGKVIAVGSMPDKAPGYLDLDKSSTGVAAAAKALFDGHHARLVAKDEDLGAALREAYTPDVQFEGRPADLGFIHRKLTDGDIYYVVNSSNHVISTSATFRSARVNAATIDPFSGDAQQASARGMALNLEPYESRVILLSDKPLANLRPDATAWHLAPVAELSSHWKVSFPALSITNEIAQPKSWTDDPATRYFSGEAIYSNNVTIKSADLTDGKSIWIDFGAGTPIEQDPAVKSGMRALLESPVREVARVSINGRLAGSVWRPPYRLEVGPMLHEGDNVIEIHVDNLAINELAGRAPANYRLLNARYGERFVPQDMDHLQPLPSGILGPVKLLKATSSGPK